jgi:hypothetical protein
MDVDDGIANTRWAFEYAATKFHIWLFCIMAALSGALAIVGFAQLMAADPAALGRVPEPVMLAAIGLIGFTLFLPFSMVLYFARHFLVISKRLERENDELHAKITEISQAMSKQTPAGEDSPP